MKLGLLCSIVVCWLCVGMSDIAFSGCLRTYSSGTCYCHGYADVDEDGYGRQGYVNVGTLPYACTKAQCDAAFAGCADLLSAAWGGWDCDDTKAGVNPRASEICDDGLDNDCDGNTDGDDSDCCSADCNGDLCGAAVVDNCGDCVGGNTGQTACTQDCNGDWGGTAYTDGCGDCVGGNTGQTACANDCSGDPGGSAYTDSCGNCVGGNTGRTACANDCAGVPGGRAYTDNCGACVGGTTGRTACPKDCGGTWGGTAYADNCGLCVGGTTGASPCTQDCHGTWGGTAYTDNCGDCVGGNTRQDACTQDCTGKWGGAAYPDDCGICVGGTTGLEKCEPITDITVTGGTSVPEYSGRVRLGPLVATDVRTGISHTFTLVSGEGDTDNRAFRILRENGASWLSPWDSFDYETRDEYSVRLQAADLRGNTFAKAVTVSVTDVGDAPIVTESVNVPLPPAAADAQPGGGTPVTSLFENVPVGSSSTPGGVAVCYADNTNGNWQYTTDDGVTWINLTTVCGAPSDITGSARVLAGDPENHIRFVPNPGYAGTAEIRYHLWNGDGWYWDGGMADVTTRREWGDISQGFVTAAVTVEPDETWIGELFASVADEDGLPVAGAGMSLSSEDGACLRNGLSDASGEFLFDMLPLADDYQMSVSGPDGSGLGDAEETGISVSVQAAEVTVTLPGADCEVCEDTPFVKPENAVLPEAGPGEITGRIADWAGTLPPGNMIVSVRIFERDGRFRKRVIPGTDGTFRATGLDPDKEYQLMVKAIGSNLGMQWTRHAEVLGFSIGVPGRDDAGAYAPGTAVSIVMNKGWLW